MKNDQPWLPRCPTESQVFAAQRIAPYINKHQRIVFECIVTWHPISDAKIQVRTGLCHDGVRNRRIELRDKGLIKKIPNGDRSLRTGEPVDAWRPRWLGEPPDPPGQDGRKKRSTNTRKRVLLQLAERQLVKATHWVDEDDVHHLSFPAHSFIITEHDAESLGLES